MLDEIIAHLVDTDVGDFLLKHVENACDGRLNALGDYLRELKSKLRREASDAGLVYTIVPYCFFVPLTDDFDHDTDTLEMECNGELEETQLVIFDGLDRGVSDWPLFLKYLQSRFPRLSALIVSQNYSYAPDVHLVDEFCQFVVDARLQLFMLDDYQTTEFRTKAFIEKWSASQRSPHVPQTSIFCPSVDFLECPDCGAYFTERYEAESAKDDTKDFIAPGKTLLCSDINDDARLLVYAHGRSLRCDRCL